MYHHMDAGLKNVWPANGYALHKAPYGEGVSINDLDGLRAAICLALTRKLSPLTGAEFRYVRSAGLMQSQNGLAKLPGNDEQAIARWQKSGKVPRRADKLIRLLYLARAEGNVPIASAIGRISAIARAGKPRIVLKEVRSGWASRFESQDESDCEMA